MTFSQDDRDFLQEWIVKPLSGQLAEIHKPPCKPVEELKADVKAIQRRVYLGVGGLAVIVFLIGILVAFMK